MGRGIARLVPEAGLQTAEAERAVDDLLRFRERVKKAPLDELLAARREGHKY